MTLADCDNCGCVPFENKDVDFYCVMYDCLISQIKYCNYSPEAKAEAAARDDYFPCDTCMEDPTDNQGCDDCKIEIRISTKWNYEDEEKK
jgi:hypothetical protein